MRCSCDCATVVREVLARQHGDRAQRGHGGGQERQQHQLLGQRQAHQQAQGTEGPVHRRISATPGRRAPTEVHEQRKTSRNLPKLVSNCVLD
jgi:hypothetical protein